MTVRVLVGILAGLCLSVNARAEENSEADSFDLLGYFPTQELQGRIRPYQFRISLLYGQVFVNSTSTATDTIVQDSTYQKGFRLELERWFQFGRFNRRPLGFIADYQRIFVDKFSTLDGEALRYSSGSFLVGWRLFGYGHSQPWTPEFDLLAGPVLESFPNMSVSYNVTSYTVKNPQILGARGGFRARFPLITGLQMLSLEIGGYLSYPMKLLGDASAGVLDKADTRSMGANALVDFRLTSKAILGIGGYFGWFKLKYHPDGNEYSDRSEFLTKSWVTSFRFNF